MLLLLAHYCSHPLVPLHSFITTRVLITRLEALVTTADAESYHTLARDDWMLPNPLDTQVPRSTARTRAAHALTARAPPRCPGPPNRSRPHYMPFWSGCFSPHFRNALLLGIEVALSRVLILLQDVQDVLLHGATRPAAKAATAPAVCCTCYTPCGVQDLLLYTHFRRDHMFTIATDG